MASVRGVIASPKSPWSKRGDLGSDASLPVTLLQTPAPKVRDPSIISEDARTMSMRGDYVVTPIKSPRRVKRLDGTPYSTRPIRRGQRSRRRDLNSGMWSHAHTRGSDIPPANWMNNNNRLLDTRPRDIRRHPGAVRYVGRDPETGLDFIETRHGTRKLLRDGPLRDDVYRDDLDRYQPHPRRGNNVRTVTIDGSVGYNSDAGRYLPEWQFVDDPSVQREYKRQVTEYKTRRTYRPPPTYVRRESELTVKGSTAGPAFSEDSIENMKGSDMGRREPKKGEFVPHWGFYVETPPSPGQSVKPRQGSVLDPHYRSRSRALDRDLLSPRSLSKSMVPTHGSTLTSPSQRGSVKQDVSDESGFHEPDIRYQGAGYPDYNNYAAPDYQRGPAPQRGGYAAARGGYQRGVQGRGRAEGGGGPRGCDPGYICTVSGVLKLVQFVTSCIIVGVTQADPSIWTLDIFILFVGVSGMVLSLSSFIFRLFKFDDSAHIGCLWFEFSCYFVVAILMFVAAILSTINANLAPSIVALTFFCFLGAGVFTADVIVIGAGMAKRVRGDNQAQQQGRQGQQPGRGGYPGGPNYPNRPYPGAR